MILLISYLIHSKLIQFSIFNTFIMKYIKFTLLDFIINISFILL